MAKPSSGIAKPSSGMAAQRGAAVRRPPRKSRASSPSTEGAVDSPAGGPGGSGASGGARALAVRRGTEGVPAREPAGLLSLARDLRSWTDFVLGIANTAADLSFRVAASRLSKPEHKAAVEKAGGLFRDLRESAGLTLTDLGKAINLKDVGLLEQVEGGKVGLPFEIILRLAGVLGRNDPIPVAMKLTRTYNPKLWATLESLGIGKLAVQAGREREFANIYRSSDAARGLSDEEFAAALRFVRSSFEAALVFRAETQAAGGGKAQAARAPTTSRKPSSGR